MSRKYNFEEEKKYFPFPPLVLTLASKLLINTIHFDSAGTIPTGDYIY
jgi:hypothetical protein